MTLRAAVRVLVFAFTVGVLAAFAPAAGAHSVPAKLAGGATQACFSPVNVTGQGPSCPLRDGLDQVVLKDGHTLLTHGADEPVTPTLSGFVPASGLYSAPAPPIDSTSVHCEVPGSWKRQLKVIYAYPAGTAVPSNGVAALETAIYQAATVINDEARAVDPAQHARLKVACAYGRPSIDLVALPLPGTTTFADLTAALRSRGYNKPNVTHVTFWYGGVVSGAGGQGTFASGDSLNPWHGSRTGGYAYQYGHGGRFQPLWGILLHEIGHTMGAVQRTAPNANGLAHCNDGLDVMCYAEGDQPYTTTRCAGYAWDCGRDTYFNVSPPAGSWLAGHWNLGHRYNIWLQFRDLLAPPATVKDGGAPGTDVAWVSNSRTVRLNWFETDPYDDRVQVIRPACIQVDGSGCQYPSQWSAIPEVWANIGHDNQAVRNFTSTLAHGAVVRGCIRNREATHLVACSNGATVDGLAPSAPGQPWDAASPDLDVTTDGSRFSGGWSAGSDAHSGVASHEYCFARTVGSSGCSWGILQAWTSASAKSTTGSVSGVTVAHGQVVYLCVRTVDAVGNRSAAVCSDGITVHDTTPPPAPQLPTATPAQAQVTVTWTSGGNDLAGHAIYRSAPGVAEVLVATVAATVRTFADPGLVNGTTYSYRIRAYDHSNNMSAPSAAVASTPLASYPNTAPLAPTGVTAYMTSSSSAYIGWAANRDWDIASYRVYKNGSATPFWSGTARSTTDSIKVGPLGTVMSCYTVRAVDTAGLVSSSSTSVCATSAGGASA